MTQDPIASRILVLRGFPADFMFQLTPAEKREVVTNRDHLARLKSSGRSAS